MDRMAIKDSRHVSARPEGATRAGSHPLNARGVSSCTGVFGRLAAFLLAAAFSVAVTACGDKAEQGAAGGGSAKPGDAKPGGAPAAGGPTKPMGLPVKAVPVTVGDVDVDISAVGTLLAEESVMIRPEIDGRVVDIHFREGQQVPKGARLISLDSAEYRAQLAQAEAQARTEAQRYERSKELLSQQFISQEAVDLAKNNLERAEALRREAQVRLSKTDIYAPFAGTVGLRLVSPGAYVRKGDDIVRLESISAIKVDFRVPEIYAAQLQPGQDLAIRLDAFPGEAFTGTVYAVEPVVDDRTRTMLVRGRVQNKGLKLKPGMFVRVAVGLEKRTNAVSVPEQALWPQGQDMFVFRVVDGKAALTKVSLGNRRPGSVEVTDGLAPGDVVITEGQIKMRDGAPVMVLPDQPPTAGAPGTPKQGG
jgi:membrane fusion protein (multidrug efflux system)